MNLPLIYNPKNKILKIVLRLLFSLVCTGIGLGYYYAHSIDYAMGQKIIGFSVLGGVVLYMPLFLYHRWKGKSLKDYTLTAENLNKMKPEQKKKSAQNSTTKKTS